MFDSELTVPCNNLQSTTLNMYHIILLYIVWLILNLLCPAIIYNNLQINNMKPVRFV
jgi:hypothetical protein